MKVIEALIGSLRQAANYNQSVEVAPVVILWTDEARQWENVISTLRDHGLPVLTYGEFDPSTRTGPAIWLRCMVSRTLPEADWLVADVPIIYLPGYGRGALRAVETCPRELQPIASFVYNGGCWGHPNGRDWTVRGYFQSARDGLGIDVAGDEATKEALDRALLSLCDERVESLRALAPLTASRINALLNPEPVSDLLKWLNDPENRKAEVNAQKWGAFRDICRANYGFDPDTDGPISAAQKLGSLEGAWRIAWDRFQENPTRYENLPDLLRKSRPASDLFLVASSWPQDNEQAERVLRDALLGMANRSAAEARSAIRKLELKHGIRREWVWASLRQSPLASVMPSLIALAEFTEKVIDGPHPDIIIEQYVVDGWRADESVLDALAIVERVEDAMAVKVAIEVLYRPWLTSVAENFQKAVRANPLPEQPGIFSNERAVSGRCLIFADGLRLDIGKKLVHQLRSANLSVTEETRLAAFPTVTATAKPAVSPASTLFGAGVDFNAAALSDRAKATSETLRRELRGIGYQILMGEETGDSGGTAWTESGNMDSYGHEQGCKLARRVPEELDNLVERTQSLLTAGWEEVVIITDHGWLLLPGGLPKAELPEHLTEIRKGRCARLNRTVSSIDHPVFPWHWDSLVSMASAPGISCYVAGKEYEHGGLSPQECVVPVITVRGAAANTIATISEVKWFRQRCRVTVKGSASGMSVDLRSRAGDPRSSFAAEAKQVSADGQASVAVPDDDKFGHAVFVVLLDSDGQVQAQVQTSVGGE